MSALGSHGFVADHDASTQGCHLLTLMDTMQDQFSRESPVYTKLKTAVHAAAAAEISRPVSHVHVTKPPPPLPGTNLLPRAGTVPHVIDQRPSVPPRPGSIAHASPGQPHARSRHLRVGQSIANNFSLQQTFSNHPSPPSQSSPSHPNTTQLPPQQKRYPTPIVASPPRPPTVWLSESHVHPAASTQSGSTPTHPTRPVPPVLPSHFPTSGLSQEPSVSVPRLPSEPVKPPNLLDEDCIDLPVQQSVAPPRPANPELLQLQKQVQEKFAAEFSSLSRAMAVDAERLRAQQADLLAGEPAIHDEMARLAAVKDVCLNVAGRMRISIEHAERNMAELRRKGDPEVDELVCSTTIVHNQ